MPADKTVSTDRNLYLEEIDGAPARKWVEKHNAVTLRRLFDDPRYAEIRRLRLEALDASQQTAIPSFEEDGKIGNFWTDQENIRGLWRASGRARYFQGDPEWKTLLDFDALARAEGRDWTYAGHECLASRPERCLVRLSEGGGDAVEIREFDRATGAFVEGGFRLPLAKQTASWIDQDRLYVERAWTPDAVTASGYPYMTKILRRGQSLDDATEAFRGKKSDDLAYAEVVRDANGHPLVHVHARYLPDDTVLRRFVTDQGPVTLPLPLSSQWLDIVRGQAIYRLREDWTSEAGTVFKANSLISFDLADALRRPEAVQPMLVFAPAANQVVEAAMATRNRLVVEVLTDVSSELFAFSQESGQWTAHRFDLPPRSSVDIVDTDQKSDDFFFTVQGFLQPATLYVANAAALDMRRVGGDAPLFDARTMEVRQDWAISRDGTRIPYFIVSKKGLARDGSNPTVLTAYGGFGVSSKPHYLDTIGKVWLERGGVYVLANIRGGGEYGADWHKAGIRTERQRVFDDFQAVAEHLIARGITSPRRLGITGASNGGLLTGVQLTQRPDLWNAVVMDVPILDMLRYHRLLAGASWMSEYGNPDDPVEGAFLRSISPYHTVKEGVRYPEALLLTSRADDRVHPGHARKMAARLEEAGAPALFYESDSGGHGGVTTSLDRPDPFILEWVYFMHKLMD